MSLAHSLGTGILCLAETNVNLGHHSAHSSLKEVMQKIWKHSTYTVLYTKEDFHEEYQPGGACTIVYNNWIPRVISCGSDPSVLGRWSYMALWKGWHKNISINTAYYICYPSSWHSGGSYTPATVHYGLTGWIQFMIADGHSIIFTMQEDHPQSLAEARVLAKVPTLT